MLTSFKDLVQVNFDTWKRLTLRLVNAVSIQRLTNQSLFGKLELDSPHCPSTGRSEHKKHGKSVTCPIHGARGSLQNQREL